MARTDEHYRQWPFPISPEEEAANGHLKSLTAREELAVFLDIRGHCLMAMERSGEAVASHATAARLAPQCGTYQKILAMAQREAAIKSQPIIPLPPDPILQSQQLVGVNPAIIEAEVAAGRAEAVSRSRRNE